MFKLANKDIIKDSAEIIKNANKKTTIPSIINAQISIVGDAVSDNTVEIFGKFDGSLKADVIIIREGGDVKGKISAKYIKIAGNFKGDVVSAILHVSSAGAIEGNIEYGIISIEEKAQIKGQMVYNPSLLRVSSAENENILDKSHPKTLNIENKE